MHPAEILGRALGTWLFIAFGSFLAHVAWDHRRWPIALGRLAVIAALIVLILLCWFIPNK